MGSVVSSVAGNLFGGDIGEDAARNAARASEASIREAIGEQRAGYEGQQELWNPQRQIGQNALSQWAALYGLNGQPADYSGFTNSPDYQFALEQGQQGLDRMQAARGNLFSGGAAKEAARFNQGLATQQYGNYQNSLAQLAGYGERGTGALSNALNAQTQGVSNALTGIGDARASGYIQGANAQTNALSNLYNVALGGAQAAAGLGWTPIK